MGKLRDHMINYMILRGYSKKTIKSYTNCVNYVSKFYQKSPLLINSDEIASFLLQIRLDQKSDATISIYYASFKFFYSLHGMSEIVPRIKIRRKARSLPLVLSRAEVISVIDNCASMRLKTILSVIYSAGLRISEVTNLKVVDIDLDGKSIFIRNAKNRKDRYTILAKQTEALIKAYINVYKPSDYLFFSPKDIASPISEDYIQRGFKKLIVKAGIKKDVHVHTLRHCFATHLLENGTSLFYIMHLLGHSNIQTTMIYLHLQTSHLAKIISPLDIGIPDLTCIDSVALNDLRLQSA